MNHPTAVHAMADVHETPFKLPATFVSVVWIVHVLPFQRSAKGWPPLMLFPTAVHAEADVHETALRRLSVVLLGSGTVWIVQIACPIFASAAPDGPEITAKTPPAVTHMATPQRSIQPRDLDNNW
jgi:hypothetical protein